MRKKILFLIIIIISLTAQAKQKLFKTEHSFAVGANYERENSYANYNNYYNLTTIYGIWKMNNSTFIQQINYAYRTISAEDINHDFGIGAALDYYQKVSTKTYVYASYAIAQKNIMPLHKAKAEFFFTPIKSWEIGIGAKYSLFSNELKTDIMTYSLSVAKYYRNYMFYASASASDEDFKLKLSPSATIYARRFFKDDRDFLQLSLNYGISSQDYKYFLSKEYFSHVQNSYGLSFRIRKSLIEKVVLEAGLSYRLEKYTIGSLRHVVGGNLGLMFRL